MQNRFQGMDIPKGVAAQFINVYDLIKQYKDTNPDLYANIMGLIQPTVQTITVDNPVYVNVPITSYVTALQSKSLYNFMSFTSINKLKSVNLTAL